MEERHQHEPSAFSKTPSDIRHSEIAWQPSASLA
jgi:hypothetical protein